MADAAAVRQTLPSGKMPLFGKTPSSGIPLSGKRRRIRRSRGAAPILLFKRCED